MRPTLTAMVIDTHGAAPQTCSRMTSTHIDAPVQRYLPIGLPVSPQPRQDFRQFRDSLRTRSPWGNHMLDAVQEENQRVSFTITQGPKGPQATDVASV
jgi:hypothetical protein